MIVTAYLLYVCQINRIQGDGAKSCSRAGSVSLCHTDFMQCFSFQSPNVPDKAHSIWFGADLDSHQVKSDSVLDQVWIKSNWKKWDIEGYQPWPCVCSHVMYVDAGREWLLNPPVFLRPQLHDWGHGVNPATGRKTGISIMTNDV